LNVQYLHALLLDLNGHFPAFKFYLDASWLGFYIFELGTFADFNNLRSINFAELKVVE
jgi:hypothetical protein